MNFSIAGKKDIREFGFGYIDDRKECHVHRFNDIPVKVDLRNAKFLDLKEVDDSINILFKSVLKKELKEAGVRYINSVEWDRVFLFNSFFHGEKDLRCFTVRFWVRIYGEKGVSEGVSVIGGK